MDSAERRTERPDSTPELHPSQGGVGRPEFSFPPGRPVRPPEEHLSRGEGAYAPMTEEPASEEARAPDTPSVPPQERAEAEAARRGSPQRRGRPRGGPGRGGDRPGSLDRGAKHPTGEPADTEPEFDTRPAAQRREGREGGRGDGRGRGDRDRGPTPRRPRPEPRTIAARAATIAARTGARRAATAARGRSAAPGGGGGMDRGRPGVYRPQIQDIFKRGQEVIVQVIKEGIGSKGPTLSTYISIPGRYLVLMPYLNRTGVSRKIEDEEARRRLRQMFNELKPPRDIGFIMRTAAIDKNKVEVQRDLVYLCRLWQVIAKRIKKLKAPVEIYQDSEMVTRTIRDNFSSDIDTIWVDEKNAFEAAQEFMQGVMPRYADRIKFYEDKEPLFHKFKVEEEIARIQQKKVPLPHGGSIVIEQTEALVAIDVNSGNFRPTATTPRRPRSR